MGVRSVLPDVCVPECCLDPVVVQHGGEQSGGESGTVLRQRARDGAATPALKGHVPTKLLCNTRNSLTLTKSTWLNFFLSSYVYI